MSREPAQLPLAFRILRSVAIGVLVFLLGCLVMMVVYSDRPHIAFSTKDAAAPVWFVLAIVFVVLIHLLVVLRSRRLASNSAGDLIVMIPLVAYLIMSLAVILLHVCSAVLTAFGVPGFGPTNLLYTLGVLGFLFMRIILIALLIRPLLVYSIRSNWVTVVPLVISYAAVLPYILLILSDFNQKWIASAMSIFDVAPGGIGVFAILCAPIMCYYVALGGVMFPTHRKLGNLWRPKPLPRLKHRHTPLKEAKL